VAAVARVGGNDASGT